MSPRFFRPATAIALAGLGHLAAPAAARTLKSGYHVRLTSTWAQERSADGCINGGEETVEGTLARAGDGRYAGTFTRRTRLLFCGAHGVTRGDGAVAPTRSCALTLEGHGPVSMAATVVGDETSPSGRSARVTWTPVDGGEAVVTGACPAAFKTAVEAMYRRTTHGAEFPLTTVGEGARIERLENYAWQVEVE